MDAGFQAVLQPDPRPPHSMIRNKMMAFSNPEEAKHSLKLAREDLLSRLGFYQQLTGITQESMGTE